MGTTSTSKGKINIMRFEQRFVEHMRELNEYALELANNKMEADDLLQTTAEKTLNYISKMGNVKIVNHMGWLKETMKNAFFDEQRRIERRISIVDCDDVDTMLEESKPGDVDFQALSYHILDSMLSDEILDAISELDVKLRTVFILAEIEKWEQYEIARFTGCGLGAVKYQLSKARQELRALLINYAFKTGYTQSA